MKNKSRFLQIGGTLLMSVLLAACSQDEVTSQDTPLPEGKYPLEFTAYGLEAVATPAKAGTRATSDGNWSDMKYPICIAQNENKDNIKLYTAKTTSDDKKTATLTSNAPFWWTETAKAKSVSAWYPPLKEYDYIEHINLYPLEYRFWEIKPNQSAGIQQTTVSGYGDFLWAYETNIEWGKSTSLTFKHLTTKVIINIMESDDYLKDLSSEDISVTLKDFFTAGQFRSGGKDLYIKGITDFKSHITPHRLELPLDKKAHTSFEALVIPQDISGQSIEIKVKNAATYEWKLTSETATKLEGGTVYTFNITLKANKLTVTTTNSMTWGDGGIATGSINLQ